MIDKAIASSIVTRIAVFACIAFFVYYVFDVFLAVLTAIVIASALEPYIRSLMRLHIPRTGAVVFVYILLISAIVGTTIYVLPTLAQETSSLLQSLPEFIGNLALESESAQVVQSLAQTFTNATSISDYMSGIVSLLTVFGGTTYELGSVVFGGISTGIIIAVLAFYLNTQEDGVGDFLRIITPIKYEKYVIGLWRRAQRNISRWLQGQLFLGLIVGIFTYVGLSIVGVRHALLLSLLAAFFEIIPVFGPILGAIPAILIGFVDGGVSMALLVAALFVVIQQLESHVMYPIVVRKLIGVPPLVVILSMIVGFKLGGILGIILAIPLATVLIEFLGDMDRNKRISDSPAI